MDFKKGDRFVSKGCRDGVYELPRTTDDLCVANDLRNRSRSPDMYRQDKSAVPVCTVERIITHTHTHTHYRLRSNKLRWRDQADP